MDILAEVIDSIQTLETKTEFTKFCYRLKQSLLRCLYLLTDVTIKINNVRKENSKPVKLPISSNVHNHDIRDRAVRISFSPFENKDKFVVSFELKGRKKTQTVDISCCQSYIFILIG